MATQKFGWCLDGHCLPGPRTGGCPGEFEDSGLVCSCTCHTGDVPDIAVRTLAADQERWEAAQQSSVDIDPAETSPVMEPISA